MLTAAVFIDGFQFYNTCRRLSLLPDYQKIKKYIESDYKVLRCYYYATFLGGDNDPMRVLADWLEYNSYTVVPTANRILADGLDRSIVKNSGQVDIAVDALSIARHVENIFLFSGDRELVRLVDELKRQGKLVTVVSSLSAGSYRVDDELRRRADEFIDLNSIRNSIVRIQTEEVPSKKGAEQSAIA